jgi:hypothetical protein
MTRYLLLLLLCFLTLPVLAEKPPQVDSDKIIFDGGKVLEYKSFHRQHQKSVDAYRLSEPIYYKEQVIVVDHWQRVIVSKYMNFFEGGKSQITVYDFSGSELNKSQLFRGKVLISETGKRIFIGQKDKYYLLTKSFLLDQDGKLHKTITHEKLISDYRMTKDGLLFLIIKRPNINEKKAQVTVIDTGGIVIKQFSVEDDSNIVFEYIDKKYSVGK